MAKEATRVGGRFFSPITRRILAINVLALVVLFAGMLYLDNYRRGLISAELAALQTQTELFAAALGESATDPEVPAAEALNARLAQQLIRRLVETTGTRARLFGIDGSLLADSRMLAGPGGMVQITELPPPKTETEPLEAVLGLYDLIASRLSTRATLTPYAEYAVQTAADYQEVVHALSGGVKNMVRAAPGGDGMVLSVAAPVQRYKQVLGALMLNKTSRDIDAAVLDVRLDILKVFAIALAVTVLLSLYLAGTIARPIRRLAAAAEGVRRDRHRKRTLPDFGNRSDEIGQLAAALHEMTEALWQRMDAIERFAADVAHEIKNPLSSLRSAVETAAQVNDPDKRRKLLDIIQQDVQRLDRLISDISDASRLDAELSRAETEPVDIGQMLATLVDVTEATAAERQARMRLDVHNRGKLVVNGIEGRLVQVYRNLIANAMSFSPPGGMIMLRAARRNGMVVTEVLDEGPGIPEGKEKDIFVRFYSERPHGEKFGMHSGLGLSISKQIIEAHGGSVIAENRRGEGGGVRGARFVVRLPVA
ncbi:MAG: stimulus-sensing domain-containing protein [Rhodospirillales bacterium]|nr:stimulus-sensing domain-containing protein [Rhodospirillales bacterium]